MDKLLHDWVSDWTEPDAYYTKECRRCGIRIHFDTQTGYAASPQMRRQELTDCNELLVKRTMDE